MAKVQITENKPLRDLSIYRENDYFEQETFECTTYNKENIHNLRMKMVERFGS